MKQNSDKRQKKSMSGCRTDVQYDGSKDNLDWRMNFRYLNFIRFIKNLRSILIKYWSGA